MHLWNPLDMITINNINEVQFSHIWDLFDISIHLVKWSFGGTCLYVAQDVCSVVFICL